MGDQVPGWARGRSRRACPDGAQGAAQVESWCPDLDEAARGQVVGHRQLADDRGSGTGQVLARLAVLQIRRSRAISQPSARLHRIATGYHNDTFVGMVVAARKP